MKTPQKTKSLPLPCPAWAKQLAALHPDDLTPDEQAALKHHIASCSDCAAVYAAYQAVDAHILSLPAVQPSAQQVARLETLIADQTHNNPHWKPAVVQERSALPARAPGRLAGIERRASLLAAVLIVMVLAGSALALFSARHASNSGGAGTSGIFYAVSSVGTVYAVDAGSGKIIWSTPLHMRASEQFLVSGGKIFTGSSDYYLYALRTSDGQLLWKRSYKDLTTVGNQTVQIAPYPSSNGNALYFGTPKGIYAWSASDGRQLWSYRASASCSALSGICPPEVATVNNGTVYAYLNGLYALNAANGSLRWKNAQVPNDTTLVVVRNHVYVVSYGGGAMRVLQADSGQLLNTPDLPRVSPFDIITDGDTVYVRSGISGNSEDVYAVRSSDDTVLWHKQYQRLLFSGVRNSSLYYISAGSSAPASNRQYSSLTPVSSANLHNSPQKGALISHWHFCAVSARDGSMQWCRQLPGNFTPLLAIANQGTLYITTSDKLEAIRLSDGKVLWVALGNVSLAHVELD
jgi:outer membrane protein assembly factor BamB